MVPNTVSIAKEDACEARVITEATHPYRITYASQVRPREDENPAPADCSSIPLYHSFYPTAITYTPSLPALSHPSSLFPLKHSTVHTHNHYYNLLPLQSWCDLFGYEAVKVIGQTCKMLQGEETEMDRIEEVMNGVKVRQTPHISPHSDACARLTVQHIVPHTNSHSSD